MEIKNKGQASIMDLTMFSLIIIVAIAFLQVYSASHSTTSAKNVKYGLQDEYAANVLLVLDYVSARGAGYQTVQHKTVTKVPDSDLESLVNASLEARNYTRSLDATLQNWSMNVTGAASEMEERIDGITNNLSGLREDISQKQAALSGALNEAKTACTDVRQGINSYAQAVGGESIFSGDDPCAYGDALDGYVVNTSRRLNETLSGMEDDLKEARENIHTDTRKVLDLILKARCLLSEAEVKLDGLISYAQLGVPEKTTLLDLVPASADLETKTVTEILEEAFYVEDRLAQSDMMGAAGATGLRVALQAGGLSLNDTKSEIAQGAILTLARKDYRKNAKDASQNTLENLLTKQGYAYCFKAATCCNEITAGKCDDIPDNAGHAVREIDTVGNETAEMMLYVWRE